MITEKVSVSLQSEIELRCAGSAPRTRQAYFSFGLLNGNSMSVDVAVRPVRLWSVVWNVASRETSTSYVAPGIGRPSRISVDHSNRTGPPSAPLAATCDEGEIPLGLSGDGTSPIVKSVTVVGLEVTSARESVRPRSSSVSRTQTQRAVPGTAIPVPSGKGSTTCSDPKTGFAPDASRYWSFTLPPEGAVPLIR